MSETTLLERLRERGWRVTPQRRAVAVALEGDHVHLTADEVHRRAREVLPEVSLATVYNTLNEMVAMGEIAEVRHAPGRVPLRPQRRPHARTTTCCARCAARCSTSTPHAVADLQLPAADRHGFTVDAVEVTFRGTCPDCLAAA